MGKNTGGFDTKNGIAGKAEALALPLAEKMGLRIYDVDYGKRADGYELDIYIDKDGGVNIQDCEAFNQVISDALDEADFIRDAYMLIVSSPGLGRKLTKDRHFAYCIGEPVEIALYKKDDAGQKEYEGDLLSFDEETVTIGLENGETRVIERKAISVCRLQLDF